MNTTGNNEPKLVFRLGHMGDVALCTGVLAYWHAARGDKFIFITRQGNAPLLENHPAVVDVIGLENDQLTTGPWFRKCGQLAERYKDHELIDLHGILRSRILSMRWKGPVHRYPKFGLARRLFDKTRADFFRKRLEATNVPQRYAMALDAAPQPRQALLPKIFLTDEERDTATKVLTPLRNDRPLIALHPYATHPAKQWPREHWQTLIDLLERAGMDWFIVGRDSAPLLPDNSRDLTNKSSLRDTCALLETADLLVTGDSGPMHLACGVDTPVVAMFGPTAQAWGFYPAGPKDIVLDRPLDCRPCSLHGAKACPKGFDCMVGISPEEVMNAVSETVTDN